MVMAYLFRKDNTVVAIRALDVSLSRVPLYGYNMCFCHVALRAKFWFYSVMQRYYLNYRRRKISEKRKAGIDPIKDAFDGMKVYT